MPKQQNLNAKEAESLLLKHGFILLRAKGSHRIYFKEGKRIVIPFHGTKSLHPKITADVFDAVS